MINKDSTWPKRLAIENSYWPWNIYIGHGAHLLAMEYIYIYLYSCLVAQMAEYLTSDREVEGSTPFRTQFFTLIH